MTPKQELFCQEYIIDLNATQAAIRAGYSKKTAFVTGFENLNKPYIQERIAELNKDRAEATGITQKRVLEEYAKIAFFDIRKLYDPEGNLTKIKDFDDISAGVVSGIKVLEEFGQDSSGNKVVTGVVKEVKLADKLRALQDLAKHLGIFEKDNKQKQVIQFNISHDDEDL